MKSTKVVDVSMLEIEEPKDAGGYDMAHSMRNVNAHGEAPTADTELEMMWACYKRMPRGRFSK